MEWRKLQISWEVCICARLLSVLWGPSEVGLQGPSSRSSSETPGCLHRFLSIPDIQFTQFLLRGIANGFRIGFRHGSQLKPAHRNLKSAYDQPQVISDYLKREVQLGRLQVVPTSKGPAPPLLQVSRFGAIPKKHKPNKWRLIVDLSLPQGQSVNDAIPADLCSVSYTTVDDAVSMMQKPGDSCLMAKVDIQEAYREVSIHPSDKRFLGLSWEGTTFIDKVLPFGLRSAPKALTDAMMWMLHDRGVVNAIHYQDDFLLLGPPGSPTCS